MKEFRANGKTPIKKGKIEKKTKEVVSQHFNANIDVDLKDLVIVRTEKGKLICHLDINCEIPEKIVPKEFLDKYLK